MREFVEEALRAVPAAMAARVGPVRLALVETLEEGEASSRWTETDEGLEIEVATEETEPHDVALEALVCLGQVLWEKLERSEVEAYLRLIEGEIAQGVRGEIDEEALRQKRRLLRSQAAARSRTRLEIYAQASFAATAAEYVHSLWHDVTVRTGEEHLPADCVRARLELLASWFPPEAGQPLFG